MTVAGFFGRYGRTLAALPSVLARWESLPDPMREHFADELTYTLAARASLAARCASLGTAGAQYAARIVVFDRMLRIWGAHIERTIGLRLDDLFVGTGASIAGATPDGAILAAQSECVADEALAA